MSGSGSVELGRLHAGEADLRVLVVGDVMLDEYRVGEVERISPEAPVPIVRVHETRFALGGAGNVARNLVALGARVELVGGVGNDAEGERVRALTREQGVADDGLVATSDRPTTHKLRVVSRGQQMLRLDREEEAPLAAEVRLRLESAALARMDDCEAVVLVDYDKGVFADGLAGTLVAAARARGLFVAADPKRELERFRGASLVKPNWAAACAATCEAGRDDASRVRVLEKLRAMLAGAEVVVTRGGLGMSALGADGRFMDVPTLRRAVFDVQGAGDTAMAALVVCRASGDSLARACRVANAAASVAVAKSGTAAVTREELRAALAELGGEAEHSDERGTRPLPRAGVSEAEEA